MLKDFLNMGSYAVYVWSSFGLTTFVLFANVWMARRRLRQNLELIRHRAASGGQP